MKIVILWNKDYNLLAQTMEKLITDSQYYLFTVICGGIDSRNIDQSLGYKWAIQNGAPIEFLIEKDIEKLLNKIVQAADYLVAYNDKQNLLIKRLIMKFKMNGKHGTIINGE